ncbi:MAG: hypothetical protein ABW137_03025 [Mycobacterium sp.]
MSSSDRVGRESPRRGGALSVVALVLSLIAVGLGAWAVFGPARKPAADAAYTPTQQSDAKAAICTAAGLVRSGITINTTAQSSGDVSGALAVQANARGALSNGGQYLLARLDPATPPELADAVERFANTLLDIGAGATAGAQNTDPEQAARLRDVDAQNARVVELCR